MPKLQTTAFLTTKMVVVVQRLSFKRLSFGFIMTIVCEQRNTAVAILETSTSASMTLEMPSATVEVIVKTKLRE